jgi:hypothetical protein
VAGWPADPPRRPVLFINPRSGDGKAARAGLPSAHATRGSRPSSSPQAKNLAALAGEAAAVGADALGMADDDGPLAVVAAQVMRAISG